MDFSETLCTFNNTPVTLEAEDPHGF
uniref:Uncharacterized protein n=1 Tax=Anguilla anguilla TaxID=7936 RepID=A0A0E9XUU6_ANGAN